MPRTPKQLLKSTVRLRSLFFAMGAVLLASMTATYLVGLSVMKARDRVEQTDSIILIIQETLLTLQNAETGQRGYLLTGDPSYLEPYSDARADIRKQLTYLREMAEEGGLHPPSVQEASDLVARKLDELQKTINLKQTGNLEEAMNIVRGNEGKSLMDAIRAQLSALENEQFEIRKAARQDDRRATQNRSTMFFLTALINLGFLFWTYRRIRQGMSRSYVASLETERQREILSVTLESIGDAVMITDTNGVITYLNGVAKTLTGWTSEEAVGKPCARVFRIINEQTRMPVPSPVDKVLEQGVIVGLANHTLLIRRDESEVPIDDSGAPIREADGTIRGVVLIFRDFSAHKEAENLLIRAKEDVEAASRAKDTFLATLSHELRTPLTPVLATLSTWEARRELPEALQPDLQLVRRNVELEARLIDDLLDLTRIEHGKLLLEPKVVDVHNLLDTNIKLFRAECEARQMRCIFTPAAEESFVSADPARLQQVFWNIVGNALKFTPDGGRIEIGTENSEPGTIKITIRDNGIGMSEETMGRLFQRFEQGTTDPQKRSQGLGLGLSIAKALILAHGGTIEAASAGIERGSVFTIFLSTAPMPKDLLPEKYSMEPTKSQSLAILLLEDHEDTALVLSSVLRSMGHAVTAAGTVAQALEKLSAGNFNLIISDLGLPDGSGLDFIQAARKISQAPAVALTGYGMADDVERCRQAGFNEHLTKPIDFDVLQRTIAKITSPKNS